MIFSRINEGEMIGKRGKGERGWKKRDEKSKDVVITTTKGEMIENKGKGERGWKVVGVGGQRQRNDVYHDSM